MESSHRFNVLGIGVNALPFEVAVERTIERASEPTSAYICFCDVNSLSWGHRDPLHRARLRQAFLVTTDGMPLVWLARRKGEPAERVYGPDLLQAICARTANSAATHYFYGGAPGVAEALAQTLCARFPGLRVAGAESPPFRPLSDEEIRAVALRLNQIRPDFIWVGLGTPRQEQWMADMAPLLQRGVLLGVGAAFDFLTGRVPQAPRWIQRSGLEWLFRLCIEPRRLAPRYFRNNPLFLLRLLAQKLGFAKYPLD